VKKVVVAKKKSTGTAKETPPPRGFIVPGLIITFRHHGNRNQETIRVWPAQGRP
jgi:hypothetical protein